MSQLQNFVLWVVSACSYCHYDADQKAECWSYDSECKIVSVERSIGCAIGYGLDVAWILVRAALDADNRERETVHRSRRRSVGSRGNCLSEDAGSDVVMGMSVWIRSWVFGIDAVVEEDRTLQSSRCRSHSHVAAIDPRAAKNGSRCEVMMGNRRSHLRSGLTSGSRQARREPARQLSRVSDFT
jgi:hypothetical protein